MFARFRTVVFWLHLAAGVVAAAIIALMSATGVLLAYEQQMITWSDQGLVDVAADPDAAAMPVSALIARIHEQENAWPSHLVVSADAAAPVQARFGRRKTVLVDPYRGDFLAAEPNATRAFFSNVRSWHRWLAMEGGHRAIGRSITGVCNLLFVFLIVSGFYLWWPRRWSASVLRSSIWFRGGLRGRARDWNWHNTLGFWCALPLLIIAVSGATISYPWARSAITTLAGGGRAESPPPRATSSPRAQAAAASPNGAPTAAESAQAAVPPPPVLDGLDDAFAIAGGHVDGWQSITLEVPRPDAKAWVFSIDRGNGRQPQKRGELRIDRQNGGVFAWQTFGDQARAQQVRSILRFGHTGEIGGLIGQTLAAIASAGGVILAWTGLALAYRRLRRRLSATGGNAPSGTPEGEDEAAESRYDAAVAEGR